MAAARADLARQRQLMRAKPAATNGATKIKKKSVTQSEALETTTPSKPPKRPSRKAAPPVTALGSANMGLVVRQVLQRLHYGDPSEYVSKTSKDELFRLLTQVAQFAYETREQLQSQETALQHEVQRKDQRAHELAGRLIELEAKLTAHEAERQELTQRLQISNDEYSSIVDTLRKYEDKWDETQTTLAHQQQLLQEMSRSLDERTAQVNALTDENASVKASLSEAQSEITKLTNQVQVLQIESERSQQQLTDERRENKALLWELQNKTRDVDDVTNQLDDAKNRVATLEGQVQMELIARKSLAQERDAVQLLHRREREEWKSAEIARGEADHRRAQEYRSMDLELRQLRQVVGRLRTDLQTEQTQREKAESTALRATDIADELKSTGKALQIDVQRLGVALEEERSTRESKEGALALAYRELQSLQKRMREEESARVDAQNEVEALMHRMKLIRRDHLAMLHRVETPPQVVARWREPGVTHHESPPSA